MKSFNNEPEDQPQLVEEQQSNSEEPPPIKNGKHLPPLTPLPQSIPIKRRNRKSKLDIPFATKKDIQDLLKTRKATTEDLESAKQFYFPCEVCFEIFQGSSGLEDHLKRSSAQITFTCALCDGKTLSFCNRCTLLLHLKEIHGLSQPEPSHFLKCTTIQTLPDAYYSIYEHYNELKLSPPPNSDSIQLESSILDPSDPPQDPESENSSSTFLDSSSNTSHSTGQMQNPVCFAWEDAPEQNEQSPASLNGKFEVPATNDLKGVEEEELDEAEKLDEVKLEEEVLEEANLNLEDVQEGKEKLEEAEEDEENQESEKKHEIEPEKSDKDDFAMSPSIKLIKLKPSEESSSPQKPIEESSSPQKPPKEPSKKLSKAKDKKVPTKRKNGQSSASEIEFIQIPTRRSTHTKFRRRPTPERVQPSRSRRGEASTSASPTPSPKKGGKKSSIESSSGNYHPCKYCSIPIPLKSHKRHEAACENNPSSAAFQRFCYFCKKNSKFSQLLYKHGEEHLLSSRSICLFCSNRRIEQNEIEEHLEEEHFAIEEFTFPHPCPLCKESLSELEDLKEHYKGHHNFFKGEHECNDCGEGFASVRILLMHKSLTHINENSSESYQCGFCIKRYRNPVKLKKHLSFLHKVANISKEDLEKMKLKRKGGLKRALDGVNCNGEVAEGEIMVKNKMAKQGEVDGEVEEVTEASRGQNSESKARLDCLKCGLEFNQRDELFKHLKTSHVTKDDPEDYSLYELYIEKKTDWWCPECGLVFVVRPSLIKHLKFVHEDCHKGSDFEEYLDKLGYTLRKAQPIQKNQCEVCRLQCSNEMEFEGHIRSHGLAYLMLRSRRKSSA